MTTMLTTSGDVPPGRGAEPALSSAGFIGGGDFTVGAEEELLLVDEAGHLLTEGHQHLVDTVVAQPHAGIVSRELFGAMIEFGSVVCTSAEQVGESLAGMRAELYGAGGHAMAAGVHPDTAFGQVDLTPAARYDAIGSNLAGLIRTPTAALQVHVGVPDPETAMTVFRGLRNRLPVLRAIAANSPYWYGRDSGLASARWAVLRSYPRSGVPPVLHDWAEYVAHTNALVEAAEVPDYTYVWWDLRIQPRFGTVEVRAMDAQPSLAVAAGLVALIQGLARHAVEQRTAVDLPAEVLDENDFRAARHGLEARIIDADGTMRTVRQLAEAAIADARATLAADSLAAPLSEVERLVARPSECDLQRRLHAQGGMSALLHDLTERTRSGS